MINRKSRYLVEIPVDGRVEYALTVSLVHDDQCFHLPRNENSEG